MYLGRGNMAPDWCESLRHMVQIAGIRLYHDIDVRQPGSQTSRKRSSDVGSKEMAKATTAVCKCEVGMDTRKQGLDC